MSDVHLPDETTGGRPATPYGPGSGGSSTVTSGASTAEPDVRVEPAAEAEASEEAGPSEPISAALAALRADPSTLLPLGRTLRGMAAPAISLAALREMPRPLISQAALREMTQPALALVGLQDRLRFDVSAIVRAAGLAAREVESARASTLAVSREIQAQLAPFRGLDGFPGITGLRGSVLADSGKRALAATLTRDVLAPQRAIGETVGLMRGVIEAARADALRWQSEVRGIAASAIAIQDGFRAANGTLAAVVRQAALDMQLSPLDNPDWTDTLGTGPSLAPHLPSILRHGSSGLQDRPAVEIVELLGPRFDLDDLLIARVVAWLRSALGRVASRMTLEMWVTLIASVLGLVMNHQSSVALSKERRALLAAEHATRRAVEAQTRTLLALPRPPDATHLIVQLADLHARPDAASIHVGTAYPNQLVRVEASEGEWFRVVFADRVAGQTRAGWVESGAVGTLEAGASTGGSTVAPIP